MTTLDNDVPLPDFNPEVDSVNPEEQTAAPEAEKKKPRARRKKAAQSSAAASLIGALKFVSPAQKKAGSVQQQHCAISGNWLVASNGVLQIGTKIEEDLTACPHTFSLLDALSKCGEELSITQLNEFALSVKSGDFKAHIDCVGFNMLELSAPDEQCAVIDDRIKAAFECVGCLATDGAQNAVHAAILLQAGTAVATNGFGLLEYWHGIDLPPGLLIPKASAVAVVKTAKVLTGFGFSSNSVTFWFEDGSFVKTHLYGERYPNYNLLFNVETNPWPLPDEFFKAVHHVESFSKNGNVYFDNGVISSRESEEQATTYRVEGVPDGMGFNAKYLSMLEHAFKTAHFDEPRQRVFFFAENARGVLQGLDMHKERREAEQQAAGDFKDASTYEPAPRKESSGFVDIGDDDIPF